jgi:hypothetical protein
MNQKADYEKDLASIRNLMEQSSKFISLSGMSGVLAGIYALAGATYTYFFLYRGNGLRTVAYYRENPQQLVTLCAIAGAVLTLSLVTGWYLSFRKAQKAGTTVWNETSKRLVLNLAIPLFSGGIFTLLLLYRGYYGIIAPSCLVFYGLALINASNNLYEEVRYLGYTEIVLGLLAAFYPGYGLFFWGFGFGVLHIFYGALMYSRYDRK